MNNIAKSWQGIALGLLAAGTVFFTLAQLAGALSAYSWQNFLMSDYGAYTNTIWNVGHGHGFKFLFDHSYLRTHLSFSLALLAPAFWVADHPANLIFVQWSFLVLGAGFLYRLGRRAGLPAWATWAFLFWYVASPFTQSVMLSEFHGVSAYYLLVPWLVYTSLYARRYVVVPFLILLGLREDAGFLLPLFFVHLAYPRRWRAGYLYAAVALAYALFAVFVLYPWLNEVSLFDVRSPELTTRTDLLHLGYRLKAVSWLLAPVLPVLLFARFRAWPLLLWPMLALVVAMASGVARQYSLRFHYPAALMSFLVPASLAVTAHAWRMCRDPRRAMWNLALSLAALAGLVFWSHEVRGLVLDGGQSQRVYHGQNAIGRTALSAAQRIPREAALLCNQQLAVYSANREKVITWQYYDPARHDVDVVFCTYRELTGPGCDWLATALAEDRWGVVWDEYPFLVLARGADPAANTGLRVLLDQGVMSLYDTREEGGNLNRFVPGMGLTRYWSGDGSRAPVVLAKGRAAEHPPGHYRAILRYRAAHPVRAVSGSAGRFSMHPLGQATVLGASELKPGTEPEEVSIPFTLTETTQVEPRIEGGDAELWLLHVRIERLDS